MKVSAPVYLVRALQTLQALPLTPPHYDPSLSLNELSPEMHSKFFVNIFSLNEVLSVASLTCVTV